GRAKIAFAVYSIVNGVTLASIFYVYDIGLIYKAFIGSSLMFGAMALYGNYTKADLSKFGSILIMGLFGVIIMTLANFIFSFFGMYSGTLDIALGYITLFIFLGLTAWDLQKLKAMYNYTNGNEEMVQTMAIYGALSLYLDFVNLFLSLLRITGSSRD
ncbi:MAG: Bax inhibitor-1/YccA family protein, partial [Clostridia bacterium]|nr:Bax inhibitor-1/YccA family protein [Clostridia bacterium]